MATTSSALAFTSVAAGYDREFGSLHGVAVLRQRVLRALEVHAPPGGSILEIGCGTGEDAASLHGRGYPITATDASPGMVDHARSRLRPMGVPVHLLSAEEVPDRFLPGSFDAVFSNFGALNCVADLTGTLPRIATLARPGGVLVLCLIGKYSLWEVLAGASRFDPRLALRRLRSTPVKAPVGDHQIPVRYYRIRDLARASGSLLEIRTIEGLNVVNPPPGSARFAAAHPKLTRFLDALDPRVGRLPVLRALGDHVVLVMRRLDAPAGESGENHDD